MNCTYADIFCLHSLKLVVLSLFTTCSLKNASQATVDKVHGKLTYNMDKSIHRVKTYEQTEI